MKIMIAIFFWVWTILLILPYQLPSMAAEIRLDSSLRMRVEYDDNIDFDSKDEQDDFAARGTPRLGLNYKTELLNVSLIGEVDVLRYFNQTDFDQTNQLYGFDGQYRMFPRWRLNGNFEYLKDETIDTQLEDTGRVTNRTTRHNYDAGGGVSYQLSQLSDIGIDVQYRKRTYSSDDTDFDRYIFALPYEKRFANQRDTLTMTPDYTFYDSDGGQDAHNYRFIVGWERLLTETLTSLIELGPRYTDFDENQGGSNDNNWGYFANLGLTKTTETFTGEVSYGRDLRANTDGNVIEVNRLQLSASKLLLERFGAKFYGAGYISKESSDNTPGDKIKFFVLEPGLYYRLTENHTLNLTYNFQYQKETDEPGNPVTQRNRAWLGVTLRFPKTWQ